MQTRKYATEEFLSLIRLSPTAFAVDHIKRLAVSRDGDTVGLVWTYSMKHGPVEDGMKEVDHSLNALCGVREVLVVQSQAAFGQLDMTSAEVSEVGQVLVAIHKTGSHMATLGIADSTYIKNVDVLVCVDQEHGLWERHDATNVTSVSGFQVLDDDKMGARIGRALGVTTVDAFVTAITDGRPVRFDVGRSVTLPRGAVLPPRMIDSDGLLALAYTADFKTYIGVQDADGNYVMETYDVKDDEVGAAMPYATIVNGQVNGYCGFVKLNPKTGEGDVTRNMFFGAAFRKERVLDGQTRTR